MEHNDFIRYYERIVKKDLCRELVNKELDYRASTYATHMGSSTRSEERVRMDEFWIRKEDLFYPRFMESFEKLIERYKEDFNDFKVQHTTDFRVNCYRRGGFMSRHVDNIHHSHGQQWGYPQVSALLFLNDDYTGGTFRVADNSYRPKMGSAIIFPSNFMYPHEVLPVKSGTRWSVVAWLM